jgi:hypothetical protein
MVCSNYLHVLHRRAMSPLHQEDIDGTIEVLDAYGLQREHLSEHLEELRQHLGAEEEFKLVDSKIKAAMTREMNSGVHPVKVVLPGSKKRKASVPEADDMGAEDEADAASSKKQRTDEVDGEIEPDAEEVSAGGLLKQKKARANAKASSRDAAAALNDITAVSAAAKAKAKAKAKTKKMRG